MLIVRIELCRFHVENICLDVVAGRDKREQLENPAVLQKSLNQKSLDAKSLVTS